MLNNILIAIFLFLGNFLFSQEQKVIMEVEGKNWIPLMSKSSYYIDSSNIKTTEDIVKNLKFFKNWKDASLDLKMQPNNIWTHTFIKNNGESQKFMLGVYSQLDSLYIFEKVDSAFVLKQFSDYSLPSSQRNDKHVRFHYTKFSMKKGETKEILMKIINRRHYNSIYADFTTVEDNLVWENAFHWEIGFFIGILFIITMLCFLFGIFAREKQFFAYSFYLFLLSLLILHEELFISIVNSPTIYNLIYRTNSLLILLVAMGIIQNIFLKITNNNNIKFYHFFKIFSYLLIFLGLFLSIFYYIDYQNLSFKNTVYSMSWYFSIFLLSISIIFGAYIIFSYFYKTKNYLIGSIISIIYLIFNPVTYFFNYSKIFYFYEISHPNYFYYILLLEILLMGTIIALQYRNVNKNYIFTLKEKLNLEKENIIILKTQKEKIQQSIIESQEQLLKNLSKDLHDDIGQKLGIINFSVENLKLNTANKEQLEEIRNTVLEISDSIRDLSHWLNDFDIGNSSFDEILKAEIPRLQKSKIIHINYIQIDHSIKNYKTNSTENIILYRIFQECFHNILKYSEASIVDITIDFSEIILFKIEDNGIGFDVEKYSANGIHNIFSRLKLIEFYGEINSKINSGTQLIICKNDKSSNH